jgi:dihydrofolate reductase
MSISADGYVAGPGQCLEHPGGFGGITLHEWHRGAARDHPVNRQVQSEMLDGMGATIMGRNMFGPIRGPWGDSDWQGWWGDTPPYHCPVFVLTHHPHDPIELQGGTTFHFVTDGIEAAYDQAVEAAGGASISI